MSNSVSSTKDQKVYSKSLKLMYDEWGDYRFHVGTFSILLLHLHFVLQMKAKEIINKYKLD